MGFNNRQSANPEMSFKKSDLALYLLTGIAVTLGILSFMKNRKPVTQLELKKELQIISVIRESDCVECIRKVICSWEKFKDDLGEQNIETVIYFTQETDDFKKEELEFLCPLPQGLKIIRATSFSNTNLSPMETPSIMVTNGNDVLHLEPIFLQTEVEHVHHRIIANIHRFLPHESE